MSYLTLCAVLCCAVAAGDAAAPHADQDALQPHTSTGSIGDTLYDAKETTVSGASVAVLILWTVAVTGWTGFQVGTGCAGGALVVLCMEEA